MIIYLVNLVMNAFPGLGFLRVAKYITVRAASALVLAFVLSLVFGPWIIRRLAALKMGQQIRKIRKENAPDLYAMHRAKEGTPTMGGVMIVFAVFVSTLLLCNLSSGVVRLLMLLMLAFALVGFVDDFLKIRLRNTRGLSPTLKLLFQIVLGLAIGFYLFGSDMGVFYFYKNMPGSTHLCFPFVKEWYPDLGLGIILLSILVITASSNAVNLTDGLDGLAIGITIITALSLAVVTYIAGNFKFARYLLIPYVPAGGEMTVFLGAIIGAGAGFLWFNAHPAQVFMGDTGSLTLGGMLGAIALLVRQELLLLIVGGVFVVEALSVVLQVASYKMTGKRLLLMSPLHHHFERLGLAESKIIARFWIVASLLALFGMSTLKLR
jgi:phospho-N-acetylmuramoyl-pentapeptide-transferase